MQLPALARLLDQCMHDNAPAVRVAHAESATLAADDVDEEDRRPTQRRRLEEAQAGGFDENMEPLVCAAPWTPQHVPDTCMCIIVALADQYLSHYVCVCVPPSSEQACHVWSEKPHGKRHTSGATGWQSIEADPARCALQPEIRLDLNNVDGPARIWAQQEPIQREMAYVFRKFLKEYADPITGETVYPQRMSRMCKGKPLDLLIQLLDACHCQLPSFVFLKSCLPFVAAHPGRSAKACREAIVAVWRQVYKKDLGATGPAVRLRGLVVTCRQQAEPGGGV